VLINANGSGAELFNSKDFKFPWAASPRVSIVGEDILFGCDIEASFFNIDGWESGRTEVAPEAGAYFMLFNDLGSSFFLDPGDVVNYRYTSLLRSSEINLRHSCSDMISVLAGFRYVELHEDLVSTVNDIQIADANVDNHLYGAQIGMNVAFVNLPRLSIEGVLKAGVFGNHTDVTMPVRDMGLFGDRTTHTSVLGEIGLMGIVQVTNSLALRGGYQAMWLDGIALAGDQYENLNPSNPKPYVGGTLFYHGAFAGLEYAF
jgi:hypothetical protein